jgi:hypothetical protein
VRQFCRDKAEHALADYRRYFSWVVGNLPWPFESLNAQNSKAIQSVIELSKQAHSSSGEDLCRIHTQIDIKLEQILNQYLKINTCRRQPAQNKCLFPTPNHKIG